VSAHTTSVSPVDLLLSRLDRVVANRRGWRAPCPACSGRSPKLSIAEAVDTGAVLLRCFAGCSAGEIVAAVGLQLADLFPRMERPYDADSRRANRQLMVEAGWRSALAVLAKEAHVIATAARLLADGLGLTLEDEARLATAIERVELAKAVLL
jgi:hypothetical protein